MSGTNNNINSSNHNRASSSGNEILKNLSEKILQAYKKLALERGIQSSYELSATPISGVGENSYGLILQVCVMHVEKQATGKTNNIPPTREYKNILKISPKNAAFRAHSRIADLYKREVFMYQQVFDEFYQLEKERNQQVLSVEQNRDSIFKFDIVPELMYACLEEEDEFLIFEDLSLSGFKQNLRTKMPTFDLVSATFRAIAKFHAMSFVLQSKKPHVFQALIQKMDDNLFTQDVEPITVEFGKKYIRKTRIMLQQDAKFSTKQIEALQKLEDNFKRACLHYVDGSKITPYAVICHGDFWNNNMLYKYNEDNNEALSAKLIDFQLSRYASPVLDLVHYLFTCTERDLRKNHYEELLNIYYQALAAQLDFYSLNIADIYPLEIFRQHLKDFGMFGFCMAAFSIPFFISNSSELPDLDEVATAIREISSPENSDEEIVDENSNIDALKSDVANKRLELLEEYDLLTERTLPIFRRRMCGIVKDLEKYDMLEAVLKF